MPENDRQQGPFEWATEEFWTQFNEHPAVWIDQRLLLFDSATQDWTSYRNLIQRALGSHMQVCMSTPHAQHQPANISDQQHHSALKNRDYQLTVLEIGANYRKLNAMYIVMLWSIFETMFTHFAVALGIRNDQSGNIENEKWPDLANGLKGFRKLKKKAKGKGNVIQRFEFVLASLGIDIPTNISNSSQDILVNFYKRRNQIAHSMGLDVNTMAEEDPSLSDMLPGYPVKDTEEEIAGYLAATTTYIRDLRTRARKILNADTTPMPPLPGPTSR